MREWLYDSCIEHDRCAFVGFGGELRCYSKVMEQGKRDRVSTAGVIGEGRAV